MLTLRNAPAVLALVQLLFWLLSSPAFAATNCAIQTAIPTTECQALVDLYTATGGASWTDSPTNGWNQNDLPCTWTGVTCSGGKVTQLNLPSKNLSGSLPSSLSNLTGLTTLYLFSNQLTGTIPTLPTGLIVLGLANNQLTGTIPTLPANLTQLNLFTNQLSGAVPALPSGLTDLDLTFNQLSGTLPTLPTGLTKLWISSNQLSGTIPTLPSSLASLRLSNNAFTGILPSFSSLTGLTMLELGFNAITSAAPGEDALVTAKQADWKTTQTLPPQGINTSVLSGTSIQVKWTVVANAGTGNFQVKYATTMGGPYTHAATTTVNQTATDYIVTGLSPNTTYYFVVQTITQPSLPQQQSTLSSELSQEVVAMTAAAPTSGYQSIPAIEGSLDFGTPLINMPSQTTLTIQEVGNAPLNISGLQITGADAASFQILPPTTPTFSIVDGGADRVITVQCLPTTTASLNATLQLLTNDSNYPTVTYPLVCAGVLNNFSLSVATTGQGTIAGCGVSCTQTHLQNSAITLVATPAVGWQLSNWSGDCVNGQVVMTANKTCTANFTMTAPTPPPVTNAPAAPPAPANNGTATGVMSNYNQTATNLTVLPTGSVSGGTLTGTITNGGLIANTTVAPNATLTGGKLSGFNTNQGTVSDVTISQYSQISGGSYAGTIQNRGLIINPTILPNAQINGGMLEGAVINQGVLHDVSFLPNTQIVGGKLTGLITGSAYDPLIIGEAELDAAKISHACLTVTARPLQGVEFARDVVQHTASGSGILVAQDFCIAPQTVANFTPQRLAATEKLAFSSFTPQTIADLPVTALSALTPSQLANVPQKSLSGLSITQYQAIPLTTWSGLQKTNMGGLTPEVIGVVDQAHLKALTVTEFQQMPGFGVAKWLTNVNSQLTVADIQPLLPTGWQVDAAGKLTAPAETQLALKALELPKDLPAQLTLPAYQFDLNSRLAVSGRADSAETLLQKMNKALHVQDSGFQAQQTELGVVIGKSPIDTRQFAFLINPQKVIQRASVETFGAQLDAEGNYQVTTVDNIEVGLIPTAKDPVAMLSVLGRDSQVTVGAQGDTVIRFNQSQQRARDGEFTEVHIVVMFDPFIEPSPSDICNEFGECDWSKVDANSQPGLHFSDGFRAKQQAKLIYPDGTVQAIYPTVFAPEIFMNEVKKLPAVESIHAQVDGTFGVVYQGRKSQLVPSVTVTVTVLAKYQQVFPSVRWKTATVLEYQVQQGQQLLTMEVALSQ